MELAPMAHMPRAAGTGTVAGSEAPGHLELELADGGPRACHWGRLGHAHGPPGTSSSESTRGFPRWRILGGMPVNTPVMPRGDSGSPGKGSLGTWGVLRGWAHGAQPGWKVLRPLQH